MDDNEFLDRAMLAYAASGDGAMAARERAAQLVLERHCLRRSQDKYRSEIADARMDAASRIASMPPAGGVLAMQQIAEVHGQLPPLLTALDVGNFLAVLDAILQRCGQL